MHTIFIKFFEEIAEKLYVNLYYRLKREIMNKNDDVYIVLEKLGFVDEEIQRLAVIKEYVEKFV